LLRLVPKANRSNAVKGPEWEKELTSPEGTAVAKLWVLHVSRDSLATVITHKLYLAGHWVS